MRTFTGFLEESAEVVALKHLYHPEELIYIEGSKGVNTAIEFIKQTVATLYKSGSQARISRKWDGAPSTVFGHVDGKFFVGSKSVFNKTPKLNFTQEDIIANHSESPGLMAKLSIALKYLAPITPKNNLIYQGDFLFDDDILSNKTIDGVDHLIFRPNTITYAVALSTPTGKDIKRAKMGIVVHTYYDNLQSSAKFLPSLKEFKESKDVFLVDAEVELGTDILLSNTEYREINNKLIGIQQDNKKLESGGFYDVIKEIAPIITVYNNSMIRTNTKFNPENYVSGITKYIEEKYKKDADKLKTQSGKDKVNAARDKILSVIKEHEKEFKTSIAMYRDMMDVKDLLVRKFNSIKKFGTFIDNGKTFVPTNDEGFVVILDSGVVKLVDRFEFSLQNFNLVKTW